MKTPLVTAEVLETAVKNQTAFGSWKDFCDSMKSGYVPTVRLDYGSKNDKNEKLILQIEIVRAGFKLYDGNKICGK